jgi:hypothetical protein
MLPGAGNAAGHHRTPAQPGNPPRHRPCCTPARRGHPLARGLQGDLIAMKAWQILEWSNGATEGQIYRLTLVKR